VSRKGRRWQQKRGKRANGAAGGKDVKDPWYERAWLGKYACRLARAGRWEWEEGDR